MSARKTETLSELLRHTQNHRWAWLAANLVAYAELVYLTAAAVSGASAGAPPLAATWFFLWLSAGVCAVASLFLAAAPAVFWSGLLRREGWRLAGGVIAGAGLWSAGELARRLWEPLAQFTLHSAYGLLSVVYSDAYYDETNALGTDSFAVRIAPQCSGYEGIGLILVFVALYLWLFRRHLRFPTALLLFPLGVAGMLAVNVLRIVALVIVGSSLSPDLAEQGFHSQSGWIGFSTVGLLLIVLAHRSLAFAPDRAEQPANPLAPDRPAAAYLVPLLALMAGSMVAAAATADGFSVLYPVPVVATGAALWFHRRSYQPWLAQLTPASLGPAVAIGVLVFLVWLGLEPPAGHRGDPLVHGLSGMPAGLAALWIVFRVLGSVLTVPMAEELAFRGYLMRRLVSADFESVKPAHFSWLALVVSSLLFGMLHNRWLAGTAAGIFFALALYRRGRVSDAIVAHVTANLLIAVAALALGHWELWT